MTPGSITRALRFALLGAGLALGAANARSAPGQDLVLNLGLASQYDDNPIQYSDTQKSQFRSGTRPDRFSIQSIDDLTWEPTAALQWSLDQGRGRRHVLRARFSGDFHSKNSTADFHALSASWRESFHGRRRLTLGVYSLPHYYLRQLVAEDYIPPFPGMPRHRRAQFDLTIASGSWEAPLTPNLDAELAYQLENRSYNRDFAERDSKTHQAKLTLDLSPAHRARDLAVSGGFRWGRAKAVDGDEPEAVPDADVSYHGPVAGIQGRMEFGRPDPWRWTGDLSYEFGYRAYDSKQTTDTYHFGRHDAIQAVEAGLKLSLRPHWSARGFYRYENDAARLGSNAPQSSDLGNYHQQQVGLDLEWSGALWRQRREATSESGD